MKYVAYYRVSTKKQGESGLGLEAQRTAVQRFTNNCTNCIVAEFTDIESGKNDDRTQLKQAIEAAKKHEAQLLIAKLDRLSRNAAFIFTLRDSQVDFICADMPNANRVTIGIMAVLAQDERERISQRTKAALHEFGCSSTTFEVYCPLLDGVVKVGLSRPPAPWFQKEWYVWLLQ